MKGKDILLGFIFTLIIFVMAGFFSGADLYHPYPLFYALLASIFALVWRVISTIFSEFNLRWVE